jgi:hypothetical protein
MEDIILKLKLNEVNYVLNSLSKMPYESVHELIAKVYKQAQEQVNKPENVIKKLEDGND